MLETIRKFKNNPNSLKITDGLIDSFIAYIRNQQIECNVLAKKLGSNYFVNEKNTFSLNASLGEIKRYRLQYDLLLKANELGVWSWKCDTYELSLSDIFLNKLGIKSENFIDHVSEMMNKVHPDDIQTIFECGEIAQRKKSKHIDLTCRVRNKENEWIWLQINGGVMERNAKGYPTRYFGIVEDVTSRYNRHEYLKHLAQTDPLTKCSNRLTFDRYFEKELSDIEGKKEGVLALIDIDYFKSFNDTCGHQIGDEILKMVSNKLTQGIKNNGLVARIGGEEFGILLPNFSLEKSKNLLETIKNNIKKEPLEKIDTQLKKMEVTITVGLSIYRTGLKKRDIFKNADIALYKGKDMGRDCVILGENYDT